MNTPWKALLLASAAVGWGIAERALGALPQGNDGGATNYHWFSVPIDVTNVSPTSGFMPVSATVDFTALLASLHVTNAVDTHALRVVRTMVQGQRIDEPCQFTPAAQPRINTRRLLPDTTKSASYVAEYRAGEATPVATAGTLTWIVHRGDSSVRQYELQFGVPQQGRAIQVPYPPHDLHVFDTSGRATPARWFSRMQIRPQQPLDGGVTVYDNQQIITKYYTGPLAAAPAGPFRRPFLYPLNGPDGISLTEFGKSHDPTGSHNHHYSLWIAHNSVDGIDFWSERGGIIAHDQFEELEDGPIYCRIRQQNRWMLGSTNILRETRTVTFYAGAEDFRIVDVALEFTPAASKAVTFGKTSFGFLAARMAQSISPFDGGGEIVNANGARNEQAVHLQHASWLDQSGPISQEKWGGLAILDHPANPGYPTVWHCRNDGWAGAAFNAEQPYVLDSGQTLRLRYRLILHGGNAAAANLAARFEEWIANPGVLLGKPRMDTNTHE